MPGARWPSSGPRGEPPGRGPAPGRRRRLLDPEHLRRALRDRMVRHAGHGDAGGPRPPGRGDERGDGRQPALAGARRAAGRRGRPQARYSAFIQGSSDLPARLRARGLRHGADHRHGTSVCCESSARDAMMLNSAPSWSSDGCAAMTDEEHAASLIAFDVQFGDVLTVDDASPASPGKGRGITRRWPGRRRRGELNRMEDEEGSLHRHRRHDRLDRQGPLDCRTTAPTASCAGRRDPRPLPGDRWSPMSSRCPTATCPRRRSISPNGRRWSCCATRLVAETPDLAGIVIGHGTATLEETAYFLSLTLKVGPGGGGRLAAAGLARFDRCRAEPGQRDPGRGQPEARGIGVLVLLNDEIQAAREVTKTSTAGCRRSAARISACWAMPMATRSRFIAGRCGAAPDTEFDIRKLDALPRVDIAYTYAGARRHRGARLHRRRRQGHRLGRVRAGLRHPGGFRRR